MRSGRLNLLPTVEGVGQKNYFNDSRNIIMKTKNEELTPIIILDKVKRSVPINHQSSFEVIPEFEVNDTRKAK
mgnify:CR=1 FL=1